MACQRDIIMTDIETGFKGSSIKAHDVEDTQSSKVSIEVGQEHLAGVVPPHESYEGFHRFDPTATWTEQEERRVIWKTDLYLLTALCVMVRLLQYPSDGRWMLT